MNTTSKKTIPLPRGVREIEGRIYLSFSFEGRQYREPLPKKIKRNQSGVAFAERKLNLIKVEIAESRFTFSEHFPDSPRSRVADMAKDDRDRTVSEGVEMWLEIKGARVADSTLSGYSSKAKRVKSFFGDLKFRSLKTIDLSKFQSHLVNEGLDTKTINDTFTPLRGAARLAHVDQVIEKNLLEIFPNLPREDEEETEADPFTMKDIEAISALASRYAGSPIVHYINQWIFACWTGLSLSEVLAIAWEDVDFNSWTIKVRRAQVEGVFKVPKEKKRTREFELLKPAIEVLKAQKPLTYMQKPVAVEVKQRNNSKVVEEKIRPIFRNTRPESPDGIIRKKSVQGEYPKIFRLAGVRARGPNQCRHTFASMLLTRYVPPDIVVSLLGHADRKMIDKHYGKIIPEDRPNVALMISNIAGFDYDQDTTEETGNNVKSN